MIDAYAITTGSLDVDLWQSTRRIGQVFTARGGWAQPTQLQVYASRDGSPGMLYAYIHPLAGSKPNKDAEYYFGSVNSNSFGLITYNWETIPLQEAGGGLGGTLVKDRKYAITLWGPNCCVTTPRLHFRTQEPGGYPYGYGLVQDGYGTYYTHSEWDMAFILRGGFCDSHRFPGKYSDWVIWGSHTGALGYITAGDLGAGTYGGNLSFLEAGETEINCEIIAKNMGIPPAGHTVKLGSSASIKLRGG